MDVYNNEEIYSWFRLPKSKYYHVFNITYVNSTFHDEKVPIFQIVGKWYWVPSAQHTKIKTLSKSFFIYVGEKMKSKNGRRQYWNILFFKCLVNIVIKEYNQLIQKYNEFCEEQSHNKELKLDIFLKFITHDDVMTFLPNKGIFKILLYLQSKYTPM